MQRTLVRRLSTVAVSISALCAVMMPLSASATSAPRVYSRSEIMEYIDSASSYSGTYTVTSDNCPEAAYVGDSGYFSFAPGEVKVNKGKFRNASIILQSYNWYTSHGTLRAKAGKNYFVLSLKGSGTAPGRVTYTARVRKNDPTNLIHGRITVKNYAGYDCTMKATVN
jgi:hypothetical protein